MVLLEDSRLALILKRFLRGVLAEDDDSPLKGPSLSFEVREVAVFKPMPDHGHMKGTSKCGQIKPVWTDQASVDGSSKHRPRLWTRIWISRPGHVEGP